MTDHQILGSAEAVPPSPSPSGPSRLRHLILRNVFWNWAGMAFELIAGFIVAPLLVSRLGVTAYGLWIVIGALSGYFGLLDLGLRGSVGRQLAFERAQGNLAGSNRILSSSLVIFSVMALVALVATAAAVLALPLLFDVQADQLQSARFALILVGMNVALSLPLQVFDGNLWAAQRFDLLNFIDIPASVTRVALTLVFVHGPQDLGVLGVITLLTGTGAGAAKALCSIRLDKTLRINVKHFTKDSARDLFGYGWWSFIAVVARLSKSQLSPMVIGAVLGIAVVTPFSIARRLQDYASKVLWTATGVLTPVSTELHATSQLSQQQRLLIEGGKYTTVAALFFLAYFVFLGRPVISLWMGRQFGDAALLLTILALGEFLVMTQSVTYGIILATAEHKTIAWLGVLEAAISLVAVSVVARPFGIVGVCLALALPQLFVGGVGTLYHGCKITGVTLRRYVKGAIYPALKAAILPVGCLAITTAWHAPDTWAYLVLYSASYSLIFGISCWFFLNLSLMKNVLVTMSSSLVGHGVG